MKPCFEFFIKVLVFVMTIAACVSEAESEAVWEKGEGECAPLPS